MSYTLCFLNLQSQSYKLEEDIRKLAIGATSLSAEQPVRTSVEDERGIVVLQHLLAVVYGGFGRLCSAQRQLFFCGQHWL